MPRKPHLSIVIPVYDEESNILPLVSRLTPVLRTNIPNHEIIFVDDGSRDKTWEMILRAKKLTPAVHGIRLRRNAGKAAALRAGFSHARADWIMTMDGDLQDQPEGIPAFWQLRNSYDLIVGWKIQRHDPWHKTIPSRFFNWLTRAVTGVRVHDSNCGMKLLTKEAANNLWLYGELHRYMPAIAHFEGYRVGEVKVAHAPRKAGRSKYGILRLVWGLFDLFTISFLMTFGKRPLHLFGSIGVGLCLAGMLTGGYLSWQWLTGVPIGNRPLLMLAILLVVLGFSFFSLGLLGELINLRSIREEIPIRETL